MQVQHGRQGLGAGLPPGGVVVAEAAHGPGLVVVVPVAGVPAPLPGQAAGGVHGRGQGLLPGGEVALERDPVHGPGVELAARPVGQAHVLELEDHVELAAGGPGVEGGLGAGDAGGLPHRQDVHRLPGGVHAPGQDLPVHLGQELVDARPVDDGPEPAAVAGAGGQGGVGKRVGLGDEVDDVHAEAVHAPVQPPAHYRVDGPPHLGVLPVEVGLPGAEEVEVELPAPLVPGPGGPGEGRAPVGGLGARVPGGQAGHVAGRAPDVPVGVGAGGAVRRYGAAPGGAEPGVLVAGVVDHQVHYQAHAAGVQARDEGVDVGQGAEERVNVLVVGDVVAVVVLGGAVDGAEPDHVHAQGVQVVQAGEEAGEVAHAVTVAVLEGAGVDLVDHRVAPPVRPAACVAGRGDQGRGGAARRGGCAHSRSLLYFWEPRMTPEMTQRWART